MCTDHHEGRQRLSLRSSIAMSGNSEEEAFVGDDLDVLHDLDGEGGGGERSLNCGCLMITHPYLLHPSDEVDDESYGEGSDEETGAGENAEADHPMLEDESIHCFEGHTGRFRA